MPLSGERLHAEWLIDGLGGPRRRDVTIRVEEGVVTRIEQGRGASSEAVPARDVGTVIPALIDAHAHLFMSPTSDVDLRQRQLVAGFEELAPAMEAHVRGFLDAGVLAVRDGGDARGLALRFRERRLADSPLRLLVSGRAFRAPRRYGRLISRPAVKGPLLAEAIRCSEEDVEQIKVVQSGLNSLRRFGVVTRPQFSLAELSAAVEAAGERGLPIMAHANGPEPVRIAIAAGCVSVEHGFFMGQEVMERLAASSTVWVPTAVTMKGYAETLDAADPKRDIALRNLEHQLEQIEMARELGVTIAAGTDAGTMGVRHGSALAEEIALLQQAGFTLEEAIASATSVAARLLGLEKELGAIVEEAPATFLVYDCSPEALQPERLASPDQVVFYGLSSVFG